MTVRRLLAATLGLGLLSAPLSAGAVEPPDFAKASQVRDSLNAMLSDLRPEAKQHGWQELRAIGMCEDALERLQDRRSAAAYSPEAGRGIWESCRRAHERARLHANPRAPDHVGEDEESH
jgi:hypothetical protein